MMGFVLIPSDNLKAMDAGWWFTMTGDSLNIWLGLPWSKPLGVERSPDIWSLFI
jgi:hypothetical protein